MYSIENILLLVIAFCLGNITAPWLSREKKNENLEARELDKVIESLKFQVNYLYDISSKFLVQLAKYDSKYKKIHDSEKAVNDMGIKLKEYNDEIHRENKKLKIDLRNIREKADKYKKRAI